MEETMQGHDATAAGRGRPGWRTAAIFAIWFAVVAIGNATGFFWPPPERPPLPLLIAVIGPAIAFGVTYWTSAAFRAFVLGLDLRLLTAAQVWRVLGGSVLAVEAQGLLPKLFAYPAGYGDLAVGVLAVPALLALIDDAPGWPAKVLRVNLLGLIDFAAAVGTGLLTSAGPLGVLHGTVTTEPLQHYPLSLIPTFLVPAWILLHLASLLQLWHLRRNNREAR